MADKKKRPYLPKEQYDQLYFYVTDNGQRAIVENGRDPLTLSSPRRYDTIQDVRKAALAKSKAIWREMLEAGRFSLYRNMTVYIYKGRRCLGFVEHNTLKGKDGAFHDRYDGMWHPIEHPKDPSPILADGSIGTKPEKKNSAGRGRTSEGRL